MLKTRVRSVLGGPIGRFLVLAVSVLLAGSLVNVVWEWRLPPQNSGFRMHSDSSLSALVHAEMPSLWTEHGFVASVHDVAAGGELIVPDPGAVDQSFMENLAQVNVVTENYEVELAEDPAVTFPGEFRISGDGVVTPESDPVRWTIVRDPGAGRTTSLRMFTWNSLPVLIDERLVEEAGA